MKHGNNFTKYLIENVELSISIASVVSVEKILCTNTRYIIVKHINGNMSKRDNLNALRRSFFCMAIRSRSDLINKSRACIPGIVNNTIFSLFVMIAKKKEIYTKTCRTGDFDSRKYQKLNIKVKQTKLEKVSARNVFENTFMIGAIQYMIGPTSQFHIDSFLKDESINKI